MFVAEADQTMAGTRVNISLKNSPCSPIYTNLIDHVNSCEKRQVSACRLPQKEG